MLTHCLPQPSFFFFFFFFFTLEEMQKTGAYKNIVIDNWEDIEILSGRDRATSIGEHLDDADEVMAEEGENEVNSSIAQQLC